MIRICWVLCFLLCGCGGAAVQSVQTIQASSTVAPHTIIFMGDSITAYWESLTTMVPGSINVGVPGNTSIDMLNRFQSDVLDKHPSVVVILAGINDISHLPDPNTDAISQMGQRARAAGITVILCTILPSSHWIANSPVSTEEEGQADIRAFNSELENLAMMYSYPLVDYYPAFENPDGTPNTSLFKDYIHPNDDGYDLMWKRLQSTLVKYVH